MVSQFHLLLNQEMASPRQVLAFVFTCFLAMIWLVSQADSASANTMKDDDPFTKFSYASDSEEKVQLSVYYESLCPYCANFIVNHLVKIFQTDLINIVNLRLVPWGNTQISSNNTWICQHGADECQLNLVEACAINEWPQVETHFNFIYCVENLHLMNRHRDWKACVGATGLDPKPLGNCYDNGLGYKLEKTYSDETARLNPPHRFVPWVVVNNLPLQEDYQKFVAYVCKAYRGDNIPKACKSTSFTTTLKSATSTPQVCTAGKTKT